MTQFPTRGKFLECVLAEIVVALGTMVKGLRPSVAILENPREVRDYLEREGLLEAKEKEALAKIYSLLSHTGGHPYMAENDQARLLRHLSLTFSQFAMLRLEGLVKGLASTGWKVSAHNGASTFDLIDNAEVSHLELPSEDT